MADSTNSVFGNQQLKSKNQTRKVLASLSLGTIVNFLIFLLVVLVLLGLFVLQKNIHGQAVRKWEGVKELQTQRDNNLEAFVQNGIQQQVALKELLRTYRTSSEVLAFLQGKTLPTVSFSSLNYDGKTNTIRLSGKAAAYTILAQQLALLKADKLDVQDVSISGATLSTDRGVDFSMQIVLKPTVVLKSNTATNKAK